MKRRAIYRFQYQAAILRTPHPFFYRWVPYLVGSDPFSDDGILILFMFLMHPPLQLLNEYEPGQGIMAHADGPFYHSRVAIISLGGPAIFRFKRRLIAEEISADSQESVPAGTVVLEPRSLIVFEGEAYHDYLHEIAAVEEEVVGGTEGTTPVLNLASLEGRINVGDRLKRALRLSLTCRRVKEEGEVKDQDDAN